MDWIDDVQDGVNPVWVPVPEAEAIHWIGYLDLVHLAE
jgi:hypothetical protein